jgi:hypothetical protein
MSAEDLKIINELRDKFEDHFQKGEYDEAVKLIDSVIKNEHPIQDYLKPYTKVEFATLYVEVADYFASPNSNNINALVSKCIKASLFAN